MKKIFLVSALFAAMLFVSCVENEQFGNEGVELSKNGIAFVFDGVKTKSADSIAPIEVPTGLTIPIGQDMSSSDFFLSETVTDLNAYGPMTKGSPIYKQNVTSVDGYKTVDVMTYIEDGGEHEPGNAIFDYRAAKEGETGLYYTHDYMVSPWPADPDENVFFFLRMPAEDDNISNYTPNSSDGSMAFDYTSPYTETDGEATAATDQKDILFTSKLMSKNEYYSSYKTSGAPVTFYHALTGVKFRVGNNNENDTKTIITKVEFIGLYSEGHAVVNPSAGTVTWNGQKTTASFAQAFDNPEYSKDKDNTVNYISGDNNVFGDSWYNAGSSASKPYNMNNLNDEAGSLTFWFVPQAFTSNHKNVTLKVTFVVKTPDTPNPTPITHTINIGQILSEANVEWKAGQLRTYTLEPKLVDVEIEDTMNGLVKSGLHVTNTGNVDEYVRMLVIGNWYGWESEADYNSYVDTGSPEPDIMVGYKYSGAEGETIAEGDTKDTMVTPWFRKDETFGDGFDETFKFGNPSEDSDWVKEHGGYYYPYPIGPGEFMSGSSQSAMTTPLFQTYTLQESWIPTIYIPDPESNVRKAAYGVHLVMEVVVQAISTKDENGNNYEDYKAAWIAATGDPDYFNK